MNPREVLGVSSNANAKEIKAAFRQAAKELHPDHSDSPEAAEAFARIKAAHDALIKESETPRESVTVSATVARASAATARAAYSSTPPQQMTDEELERIQNLDDKVRQPERHSIFLRSRESAELRRHRKKLKTNERRMRGLY